MFFDRKAQDSFYLIVYTLFIYASLPFAPNLWDLLYKKIGKWTSVIPFVVGAIIAVTILLYLLFYKREKNLPRYAIFLAVGIAYILGMRMVPLPAEKLHFLEYGGVGYFSLRPHSDKKHPYLWAAPVVLLIGFIDEFIQYILPNRAFEIHDILTNFAGGILSLVLMKFVIRARGTKGGLAG